MYTMEMYNALVEAIATGAKEVWYGDKRVAYRSLTEMYQVKADMEAQLGLNKQQPRRWYPSHSKGV